jgi:NOL1/NOP2/sun family putative RNA methylase
MIAPKQTKIGKKIYKKQIGTLGSTHEYLMGKYYIQSISSMLPAIYLNPKEDDIVIDMCAAPGGKTTQLAQLMNNKGKIIAIESSNVRIKSLIYNLRRCGVRNTTVLNMDATKINGLEIHPKKILLDAPCSGEGIIREDPSRKKSKSPDDIKRYMGIQMELLMAAVKSIIPGGYVMYSTCSIAPEENEFIIQNLLESYKKVDIEPINDNWGYPGFTKVFDVELSEDLVKARRYYPHIHNTDGFFICLLKKKA